MSVEAQDTQFAKNEEAFEDYAPLKLLGFEEKTKKKA